eukprot:COSAG02_NODE_11149_length_1783_cov_1.202494_3_plen_86_part_00
MCLFKKPARIADGPCIQFELATNTTCTGIIICKVIARACCVPIGKTLGSVPVEVSSEIKSKSAVLPPVQIQAASQQSQSERCSRI